MFWPRFHPKCLQATQKRAETFSALQSSLDDLIRRMDECEQRNAEVVNHLTDLDNLLQDEKAKWGVRPTHCHSLTDAHTHSHSLALL